MIEPIQVLRHQRLHVGVGDGGRRARGRAFRAGAVCRAAVGNCDIAESCDGVSAACPANAFVPAAVECRGSAGVCDVAENCTGTTATCPANGYAASTVVCRAAAGECVNVTLRNRLPALQPVNIGTALAPILVNNSTAPDLATYSTIQGVVKRDRAGAQGSTTFNMNLIRPSSYAGLHPQLVAFDVTKDDGVNVGQNFVQTAGPVNPGDTVAAKDVYKWYLGDIGVKTVAGGLFQLVATPVEFGGSSLIPADKIKQLNQLYAAADLRRPDIVLLDMKMGRDRGDAVLEILLARYPGLCVIIVTGYPSLEDMRATFKLKVFDYLAKPFSLAQLRQTLANAVQQYGLGRSPQDRLRERLGHRIRILRAERDWSLKDLAASCRKQDIKLFFYYSQLDWHHPDYFPRGRTGRSAASSPRRASITSGSSPSPPRRGPAPTPSGPASTGWPSRRPPWPRMWSTGCPRTSLPRWRRGWSRAATCSASPASAPRRSSSSSTPRKR